MAQSRRVLTLRLEPLESRQLMAIASATLANGVLTVVGTDSDDTIQFHNKGGKITLDGFNGSFTTSQVQQIVVNSKGGNDTVRLDTQTKSGEVALTCKTQIFGGVGNDKIWGCEGEDWVDAGDGTDTVYGNGGNDCLYGDLGADSLDGGAGNDKVFGGDANDALVGGDGDDLLDGGKGNDRLGGGKGTNTLYDDTSGTTFDATTGKDNKVNGHTDWISQNVSDAALRAMARLSFIDGALSRTEVLALFRQAEVDGKVNQTEYTDLKALANNGSSLGMTQAVSNLAGKTINGLASPGNNGVAATQLESLVGRWFLGTDRPVGLSSWGPTYSYVLAAGSLFVNGASYSDIVQGGIGDCYFVSALADVANTNPNAIRDMFTDNGDGTFTVRFYNRGTADYVTVDRYLPASSGMLVFAGMGRQASSAANELWVSLAEKAYVQWASFSSTVRGTMANVYDKISGGYIADALAQITGKTAALGLRLDENSLVAAVKANAAVGLASKGTPSSSQVVGGHAYSVLSYDASTKLFTLFNPWGVNNGSQYPGILKLTFAEIVANFAYFDRTV